MKNSDSIRSNFHIQHFLRQSLMKNCFCIYLYIINKYSEELCMYIVVMFYLDSKTFRFNICALMYTNFKDYSRINANSFLFKKQFPSAVKYFIQNFPLRILYLLQLWVHRWFFIFLLIKSCLNYAICIFEWKHHHTKFIWK